ncbi:hypothetical protein OUZ56_031816 [Daphnia magna]|uniref:Uncharacterized protein n=1 Tax=Daphnia magna TaxID=35525 RepID=A0ABQ9ZVA0_9CRUS|nr:hypothetical protein OUZ56_031816 [Daphnia magna]
MISRLLRSASAGSLELWMTLDGWVMRPHHGSLAYQLALDVSPWFWQIINLTDASPRSTSCVPASPPTQQSQWMWFR